MRKVLLVLILGLFLVLPACSGSDGKELFDTAKFEELQNNNEHARELYEEVVKKYPKSEYARKAEERLRELKGISEGFTFWRVHKWGVIPCHSRFVGNLSSVPFDSYSGTGRIPDEPE